MKKNTKIKKNLINKKLTFLFFVFLILIFSVFIYNSYTKKTNDSISIFVFSKVDKVIEQFFSDLITNDIINDNTVSDLYSLKKNKNGEIILVDYNLEKTYQVLTNISQVLEKGLLDLENGQIDVKIFDQYLESGKNNLILYIPFFLNSKNIFINNLGPRIPVVVNLNNTLLTNIKTKVTDYGLNNALVEIYVTVEIKKTIITPISKNEEPFYYDILISSTVISGSIPKYYGGTYEQSSGIFSIYN